MNLKEQLKEDLKVSLKERDEVKTGTLRMLMAAITNKEKEGKEVTDEQLQDVVATEAKKRREASDAFLKGARPELAEKEQQELKILFAYLPDQLTEEQIQERAKKAIKEAKHFGNVNIVASSSDSSFNYIPKQYDMPENAAYFHITTNNTLLGTLIIKYYYVNVPLFSDMSSELFILVINL